MPFKYMIAARLAMRGTFGEPFELYSFPFDVQDLKLTIASTATTSVQILVPHFRRQKFCTIATDVSSLPEWELHEPFVRFDLSDPAKSARKLQYCTKREIEHCVSVLNDLCTTRLF